MMATTATETTALGVDLTVSSSVAVQALVLAPSAHFLVRSHGRPRVDQVLLRLLARNNTIHEVPGPPRTGSGG